MATCRDIITYAMRQAKVIASGDTPTADELNDGLVALQSLYDSWVADGMFGRLTDTYQSSDYTAGEGQRVIAAAGVTVTIPTTIDADCGERSPRDLSVIETVIDGTRAVQLWDRSEWVPLLGLAASDDAPLSSRGAWGLAATLATSGAFIAMFGGEPGSDIRLAALRFQNSVATKFGSTRDDIAGEYY